MTRLRVMTLLGTRPEIIRLSRVIPLLDEVCDHVLVHTGQNYDPTLSDVFFEQLGLRRPDHQLSTPTTTVGAFLGDLFRTFEALLSSVRPDALLILGDTNSSLASFLAKRMGITVFHMEAGNRCFDANVPEEINRRVIDHLADINLAYTEHARRNLLAEGLHPRSVYLTGSPLREVLDFYRPQIDASPAVSGLGLEPQRYFTLSLHREENVDEPDRLQALVGAVEAIAASHDLPVIASTHPRTLDRLRGLGAAGDSRIVWHEPFGFFDYIALQQSARCVLSDSGTVSEEAAMLGFPAVTMRNSIERPEAMDAGTIVLTEPTPAGLEAAVAMAVRRTTTARIPDEYQVTNCSERVVNLVVGLTALQPLWDGIRRPKRGFVR